MPSVTQKCKAKGCPFTPDEHEEWMGLCRKAPEHGHRDDQLSHQHLPKKGMGGHNQKSKIEAILCWPMHDRIDNGDWGNGIVVAFIDGQKVPMYRAFDLHNNTLIERPVLSAAAEVEPKPADVNLDAAPLAAAPSAGEKEESDGQVDGDRDDNASNAQFEPTGHTSNIQRGVRDSRAVVHPVQLTHEQRVAIAQEIKNAEWNRQWIAGDTGNQWIAELGEEAEQYLSDFGYVHESLSNILRVCAAIPPPYRNGALRYSHHVVVYELPREEQMLLLMECEQAGWSVAEFRRQVKRPKPQTKRWPMSELLEGLEEWNPTDRPRPKGAVRAYLTWLGGQK